MVVSPLSQESARLYRLERLQAPSVAWPVVAKLKKRHSVQARQRRRSQLFSSATSQLLLKRLLGGVCPVTRFKRISTLFLDRIS